MGCFVGGAMVGYFVDERGIVTLYIFDGCVCKLAYVVNGCLVGSFSCLGGLLYNGFGLNDLPLDST